MEDLIGQEDGLVLYHLVCLAGFVIPSEAVSLNLF